MSVTEWSVQRLEDLSTAFEVFQRAVDQRTLPDFQSADPSVLSTTSAFGLVLVILLIPKLRKFVWDCIETVLAVLLIILLLGVVLGMPFGAVYIGYQGMRFLAQSLLELATMMGPTEK